MANYMAEVAKMLGVEMGEVFIVEVPSHPNYHVEAFFRVDGLGFTQCNVPGEALWIPHVLKNLITGIYTIKHKPWKPKPDERFYVVTYDGTVMHKHWDNCSTHINYYKLGNFYRTYGEADANRDKWVSFYASDEVLEI